MYQYQHLYLPPLYGILGLKVNVRFLELFIHVSVIKVNMLEVILIFPQKWRSLNFLFVSIIRVLCMPMYRMLMVSF